MKYQDHSITSEAMNQNTEVNGERMHTPKFMGHEKKKTMETSAE
jgi:hypothetical protein